MAQLTKGAAAALLALSVALFWAVHSPAQSKPSSHAVTTSGVIYDYLRLELDENAK